MANEYLKRTPTSAGNRKVWTWSGWIKIAGLPTTGSSGDRGLFSAVQATSGGADASLRFSRDGGSNPFQLMWSSSRYNVANDESLSTVPVFRDTGNWMHVLFVRNTPAPSSTDRVRFYINGIEQDKTESNAISLNEDVGINELVPHAIGDHFGQGRAFRGEMFDVFFVDGQALTPDVFGFYKEGKGYISAGSTQSTDFRPGQWLPKSPRVVKTEINRRGGFGVNGFYLPMNDSSNFGADFHCDPNTIITLKDESAPQPKNGAPTTSDNYISELRSDSNASNLVLAVPGIIGATGVAYTDFSANIKGSGTNKVLTANGNAGVALTDSYYGSAMEFDGSGDYFSGTYNADFNFGTGDFTIEMWAQPKTVNSIDGLFAVNGGSGANPKIIVHLDNGTPKVHFGHLPGSSNAYVNSGIGITADQWHHLAFERNGSQATWYVNGVVTGLTTALSQDVTFTNQPLYIGYGGEGSFNSFDGFIQDLRVYSVAKYKGGFDVSKPYAPVGIETFRAVSDICTNNFATMNPLIEARPSSGNNSPANSTIVTFADGNLNLSNSGSSGNAQRMVSFATIGITTGKWYYEEIPSSNSRVGLSKGFQQNSYGAELGSGSGLEATVIYQGNGTVAFANTAYYSTATTLSAGSYDNTNIIGVSIDASLGENNLTVEFYKDGVGVSTLTGVGATSPVREWFPTKTMSSSGSADQRYFNFGQNPTFSGQTTAGTYTDSNGKGLFKYQPPTGFLAMCEDNLPTPAIADPGEHFKCVLWTGDGNSGRSITGVGFKPDFVWLKKRNDTTSHNLTDSVRGVYNTLFADDTSANNTNTARLQSFDSDGFSIGNHTAVNNDGDTFVAWCWKAGGAAVANTDGSINSSVSVNQTAGFSIVSYTGTGSVGTVGHGLGKRPKVVIVKDRDGATNWPIFFDGISDNQNEVLQLNLTNPEATAGNFFNGGDTTTTTFPLGTGDSQTNASGNDHIAYCWAEIDGYSKFGSYVGNGNADGPFVYCGFKPAWVMVKRSTTGGNEGWPIYDNSRGPINPNDKGIYANSTGADNSASGRYKDFVSNGFKIRGTSGEQNTSGITYVFMAFAESPFQTANAK